MNLQQQKYSRREAWDTHWKTRNDFIEKSTDYQSAIAIHQGFKRIIDLYTSEEETLYYSSKTSVDFLANWSG